MHDYTGARVADDIAAFMRDVAFFGRDSGEDSEDGSEDSSEDRDDDPEASVVRWLVSDEHSMVVGGVLKTTVMGVMRGKMQMKILVKILLRILLAFFCFRGENRSMGFFF